MSNYLCPICKGQIKINGKIIFSTKTIDNKVGLILMNPSVGDYSYMHHPFFQFVEGEKVDFYCPICHTDFKTPDIHENLAKVIFLDNKNQEHEIIFSRIAGEKCTFRVKDSDVEQFGEDCSIYFESLSLFK